MLLMVAIFVALAWLPASAAESGPVRVAVERFAVLPPNVRQPEGLAADPTTCDLFVGTFDAREPESTRNNHMQGDEWEEQVTRWTLSRFRMTASSK